MNKRFIAFIGVSFLIIYFSNYLMVEKRKENHVNSSNIVDNIDKSNENINIENRKEIKLKINEKIEYSELNNDYLKVMVSSIGAVIDGILLKKFDNGSIELIADKISSRLSFFDLKISDKYLNLENNKWFVDSKAKNEINLTTNYNEIEFLKKIHISEKSEYAGKLSYIIKNKSDKRLDIKDFFIDIGPINNSTNDVLKNYQVDILSDGKISVVKSGKKEEISKYSVNNGWIGIKNQYFCKIFYSKKNEIDYVLIEKFKDQTIDIKIFLKDFNIDPLKSKNIEINLYFGPQNYQILKNYGYKIYKIVNFGFFHYIGLFILFILKFLFNFTKNYGISIILLTLIIKGILWWPTQKSYTSMKNMQNIMNKMQPRLKTIKEIYKDNPQKLNEETMKLYKEYKINPMGGCLPLLLQMPIFFALYTTLTNAVELKGASFFWIWKDLSLKDPSYILPISMGISMFIQQKISTTPAATPEAAVQQKMMLYLMPIMLTFFSFVWPSGLLLYWVTYNIASIVQQVIINRST